MLQFITFKVNL